MTKQAPRRVLRGRQEDSLSLVGKDEREQCPMCMLMRISGHNDHVIEQANDTSHCMHTAIGPEVKPLHEGRGRERASWHGVKVAGPMGESTHSKIGIPQCYVPKLTCKYRDQRMTDDLRVQNDTVE